MADDDYNPKKRGLGRGLNALFEDEEGVYPQIGEDGHTPGRKRDVLGTELLTPGTAQPRRSFDDESLIELSDSIRQHGLLQPILVRRSPHSGDMYEIIAGERRWRAAQRAQLHEVPVIILDLTDIEALEIALIENLQREDLNAVDEARGYQRLLEEFGHTQEKLAKALGKSRPHIANMVRLLSLPDEVLDLLRDGKISAGHARALITADDPKSLAREVLSKGLNVRQTELLAAGGVGKENAPSAQGSAHEVKKSQIPKDSDTLALEKDLSDTLGMKVLIDTRDGVSGSVRIEFMSLDQLDDLIAKLSSGQPSRRFMA
jgi:ParB family transcriptional regulator, chromosome partitioning protein